MAAESGLLAVQDAYYAAWNRALKTGDAEPAVRYLSAELRSWFFRDGMDGPSTSDSRDYADSIRNSLGHLGEHARWTLDVPLVAMRGETEGVIGCRVKLERADRVDPLLTLSLWRREDGQWRLLRTYEEVGRPDPPPADELLAAHDLYEGAWHDAWRNRDAQGVVELMAADLESVLGNGGIAEPKRMNAEQYRQGCLQVVQRYPDLSWRVAGRVVEMRRPEEGVALVHGLAVTPQGEHAVFSLEVWRKFDGRWRLKRIYEEA